MAFEFIDLTGILFVVLLSTPQTLSTNTDCAGRPFHCLDSSHFMICVDLGGGVSTTIDEFIIPCPPKTECRKSNRFECEYPKIEVPTTANYVEVIEVTTVSTDSSKPEVTTKLKSEILENLKDEFASGNEHFFEGPIVSSTNLVSFNHSADKAISVSSNIDEITSSTDKYSSFTVNDTSTLNAVNVVETVIPKLKDTIVFADTTNQPAVTSNNEFYSFNQTDQNYDNNPNRTTASHFIAERSYNIEYVGIQENSSTTDNTSKTVREIMIDTFSNSSTKTILETQTKYNDQDNLALQVESELKLDNSFTIAPVAAHGGKSINNSLEASSKILKKNDQYINTQPLTAENLNSRSLGDLETNNSSNKNSKNISKNIIKYSSTSVKEQFIEPKSNNENTTPERNESMTKSDTLTIDIKDSVANLIKNDIIFNKQHNLDKINQNQNQVPNTRDVMPANDSLPISEPISTESTTTFIITSSHSNNNNVESTTKPTSQTPTTTFINNFTNMSSNLEDSLATINTTIEEPIKSTLLNNTHVESTTDSYINFMKNVDRKPIMTEIVETIISTPETLTKVTQIPATISVIPAPQLAMTTDQGKNIHGGDIVVFAGIEIANTANSNQTVPTINLLDSEYVQNHNKDNTNNRVSKNDVITSTDFNLNTFRSPNQENNILVKTTATKLLEVDTTSTQSTIDVPIMQNTLNKPVLSGQIDDVNLNKQSGKPNETIAASSSTDNLTTTTTGPISYASREANGSTVPLSISTEITHLKSPIETSKTTDRSGLNLKHPELVHNSGSNQAYETIADITDPSLTTENPLLITTAETINYASREANDRTILSNISTQNSQIITPITDTFKTNEKGIPTNVLVLSSTNSSSNQVPSVNDKGKIWSTSDPYATTLAQSTPIVTAMEKEHNITIITEPEIVAESATPTSQIITSLNVSNVKSVNFQTTNDNLRSGTVINEKSAVTIENYVLSGIEDRLVFPIEVTTDSSLSSKGFVTAETNKSSENNMVHKTTPSTLAQSESNLKGIRRQMTVISNITAINNMIEYQNKTQENIKQHIVTPPHTTVSNIKPKPIDEVNDKLKLSVNLINNKTITNETNQQNNTLFPFNCLNLARGKYADSNDCRKFYTCLGNLQPVPGVCPNDTVFSEINKHCTRNLSHCVRNNQFHCLNAGRFSDFLKDNIYYICVKNKSHGFLRYKLQCDNGYYLNKDIVKCEKYIEPCNQSVSSATTSNEPNSQFVNSGVSDQSKQNFIECKTVGRFPYPNDCRKYYMCSKNTENSYLRKIKTCSSDEIYDATKKDCVSAESVEC